MLLGRSAIESRAIIDPQCSYLVGRARRQERKGGSA
jgi:hypothetical protein